MEEKDIDVLLVFGDAGDPGDLLYLSNFMPFGMAALLDLAVKYGADIAKVADEMMSIAERSGLAEPLIAATEQDIGAWFAEQATQATGPQEDQLAALIDAMRDAIGADAAQDILARAGVTAPAAAASGRRPSARSR